MLELIRNYSGIAAIIGYSLILFIILKLKKPVKEKKEPVKEVHDGYRKLDLNDEDAVVAGLIASIECHNETKKNVRVISVREIG